MTWPEVKAEQQRGRDTVVVAFGATEQYGLHLPLATDALIGDHLARLVAERLGAVPGIEVSALRDLGALFAIARRPATRATRRPRSERSLPAASTRSPATV